MTSRIAAVRWRLVAGLCASGLFFASCGAGSEETAPSPTPDTFDPNVLNALVLQPEEVSVPLVRGVFDTTGSRVTYTATFGDSTYAVQAAISRIVDDIEREQHFSELRTSVNSLVGGERNYQLPESDLAFKYKARVLETPNAAVLALKDDYIMLLTITADDLAQAPLVFDDAVVDEYVAKMFDRIRRVASDPDSITPVASAPTFAAAQRDTGS